MTSGQAKIAYGGICLKYLQLLVIVVIIIIFLYELSCRSSSFVLGNLNIILAVGYFPLSFRAGF